MRMLAKRQGFTLIEIMMAMVVVSVGLFSLVHMQVVGVRGSSLAKERNEASQIARGVMEEMRIRSLAWVDLPTMKSDFEVVSGNMLTAIPAVGSEFGFSDLRSVMKYHGYNIAASADVKDALRITGAGVPETVGGLAAAGAIYRVHYVAARMRLDPTVAMASDTAVFLKVYVTWSNKDPGHGEAHDWGKWDQATTFWKRHLVTASTILMRQKKS